MLCWELEQLNIGISPIIHSIQLDQLECRSQVDGLVFYTERLNIDQALP